MMLLRDCERFFTFCLVKLRGCRNNLQRSLKVIGDNVVRYRTYGFLLVVHRNYTTLASFPILTGSLKIAIFSRPSVAVCTLSSVKLCIVAKWCVLEQKLLLTAYRKSYMRNRLVPKWMILTFV